MTPKPSDESDLSQNGSSPEDASPEPGSDTELRHRIEAALYVSSEPLSAADLSDHLDVDGQRIRSEMVRLREEYDQQGRGMQLIKVAGGFKMTTREQHYGFLKKLFGQRTLARLSDAAVESLVIVAYHQPITRAELESVRGVNCQSVVETLMEKDFIRIGGRRDEIGRPIEYSTTQKFLDYFGLNSINDLPDEEEIESLVGE